MAQTQAVTARIRGTRTVRRLFALAVLALAGACEAPVDDAEVPAAEMLDSDPGAFRADSNADTPPYAGEWAASSNNCGRQGEVWTVEENRMGMKRKRFCVFDRVFSSGGDTGQGWSASARCLANGRESHDFVFFRVSPNRLEMRVTINDAESVELVRCPMRT
jgi:hypothetical protein